MENNNPAVNKNAGGGVGLASHTDFNVSFFCTIPMCILIFALFSASLVFSRSFNIDTYFVVYGKININIMYTQKKCL